MAEVRVNGHTRQVQADDDTALLYVLRNHLGLKGTRFGCGLGVCGACAVLVDGHRVGEAGPGVHVAVRLGEARTLLATLPGVTFVSRYRESFAT